MDARLKTWMAPLAVALAAALSGCQEDGDKTPDELEAAPGEESRMQERSLPEQPAGGGMGETPP